MTTFRGFDGGLYEVPDEQAGVALEEGWTQATPEEIQAYDTEKQYGNRPIAAGAASAARQFTASASDWLLPRLGLVEEETLQGLRAAPSNEAANVVGGLTGGLASAFVGPLRAVGAAGQGVLRGGQALVGSGATSLAGRAAQAVLPYAAQGGFEGTVFGLINASTEEALNGDAELTGEQLASYAWEGFKTGVEFSPVAAVFDKAVGGAVSASREAAAERAASRAVPVMSETPPAASFAGSAERAEQRFNEAAGAASSATGPGVPPSSSFDFSLKGLAGSAKQAAKKFDSFASGFVEKHADDIIGIYEGLGMEAPTAEALVLRGLDVKKKQAGLLRQKGMLERAPRALLDDERYAAATTPQQLADLISEKMDEALPGLSAPIKVFDAAATREELISGGNIAERIRNEVIAPLKEGTTLNDSVARRIAKEADAIEEWEKVPLAKALEYRRRTDPKLKWDSLEPGDFKDALRDVRRIVNEELNAKAEAIGSRIGKPEVFQQWRDSNRLYGEMAELSKIAADRLKDAKLANREFSLTDNMWGAGTAGAGLVGSLLTGNPLPLAGALAAPMVNKWGRERLPQVMALALDRAAKKGTAEAVVAAGFQKQVKAAIEADDIAAGQAAAAKVAAGEPLTPPPVPPEPQPLITPPPMGAGAPEPVQAAPPQSRFGPYRNVLQKASEKGPGNLLATHIALLAAAPDYAPTMEKAGLMGGGPEDDDKGYERAVGLSKVAALQQKQEQLLDEQIAGFISKSRGGRPAEIRIPAKEYKQHLEQLTQMAINAQAMAQQASPGGALSTVAPSSATNVATATARAAQYLQGIAPKPPEPTVLPSYAPEWRPAPSELSRYQRIANAVMRPMSVLEDLRRGRVTHETADALRTVYPRTVEWLGQRFLEKVAESGSKLTYQQRLNLSVLLAQPLDPSLEPSVIASYQSGYQSARQALAEQSAVATRSAGRSIKLPSLETPSQSLEQRSLNAAAR